ncbi:hypothetical protein OAO87_00910 [bacterium]|nr:hypothetical protein [bacterium]
MPDRCPDLQVAHTCRSCGTGSWWIMVRSTDSPADLTPQALPTSCALAPLAERRARARLARAPRFSESDPARTCILSQ